MKTAVELVREARAQLWEAQTGLGGAHSYFGKKLLKMRERLGDLLRELEMPVTPTAIRAAQRLRGAPGSGLAGNMRTSRRSSRRS
jgi:hypothetical protein